jgi:hypothetical protein
MKTAIVHAQQKWEHIAVTRKTESVLLDEINQLGEEGWELVSTEYFKDPKGIMTWIAYLKRPKVASASKPQAAASPSATGANEPRPAASSNEPAGFDLSGEVFDIKK